MSIDLSLFRHLYPFQSHFKTIHGLKYHYIDEGQGDPIIMVHGNPTWSFFFRALIKTLSPQYQAIAVDHIGCGLSDKPDPKNYGYLLKNRVDDLEAFILSCNFTQKLTLVVHDWGGMIAMAFAVKHPEKIGRIVITNTAAFLMPKQKRLPLRLWLIRKIPPMAAFGVLGFNLFAKAALYMASCKGLPKDVKQGLIAPYNSWQNRIATLKFVQDIPLSETDPSFALVKTVDENLHQLSHIPMLICWGKHDFVFDLFYFSEWKRRFPNADACLFDTAGHYLFEDEPEKVTSRIKAFLDQHPLA